MTKERSVCEIEISCSQRRLEVIFRLKPRDTAGRLSACAERGGAYLTPPRQTSKIPPMKARHQYTHHQEGFLKIMIF